MHPKYDMTNSPFKVKDSWSEKYGWLYYCFRHFNQTDRNRPRLSGGTIGWRIGRWACCSKPSSTHESRKMCHPDSQSVDSLPIKRMPPSRCYRAFNGRTRRRESSPQNSSLGESHCVWISQRKAQSKWICMELCYSWSMSRCYLGLGSTHVFNLVFWGSWSDGIACSSSSQPRALPSHSGSA